MSGGTTKGARPWTALFNLPNQLTSLRLILAIVLFCFLALDYYVTSIVLFLVAASTDWLDGYYARRYGQVTTLGRMLDPFADKVIICGTFIFLVTSPVGDGPWPWYLLNAWMVVVIVGRELLVTALRSEIESRGSDFSAKMPGKLKMVFQCVAAVACMYYLARGGKVQPWAWWTLVLSLWIAVVLTIYSGLIYVHAAVKLLRGQ